MPLQRAAAQAIPAKKHLFTVICHRGDHVLFPENTIAAYESAIKNNADYVEIDLRTTKDSVLVIMHDATVDRMTNGKGKVSDLTFAQIQQLKVYNKNGDTTKTYSIPTFEQVLQTCKNNIHIYLDFKNASVQQAYNIIKQYGMQHEIIVYINAPWQYTDWKRIAPAMPLMVSLPNNVMSGDGIEKLLLKTPVALLDGSYSDYTKGMFDTATKTGVTVWPDIQSPGEAANWDKAIEIGFTGLQTDHPEALIEYLKKKGLR
ncbi:MAG TPA: glycerophosphodiester phosphodiesterase family protein [Chitinophagaceae bacterium]|nr:glycerophosphodiester phosphodiesterase family protein [Chitinophagaceae bacterium]